MAMAILGNENAISSHCLWPLLVVEEPYETVGGSASLNTLKYVARRSS
jgi:hypothetical protein